MEKYYFVKNIISIPLAVFICLAALLGSNGLDFYDAFCFIIIRGAEPTKEYISDIIQCLIPFILFATIFANYIYKDLTTGGVYIFTRQKNRYKWYFNRIFKLFSYSLFFNIFYFLSIAITLVFMNAKINFFEFFILLLYSILIYTLFNYIFILLINVISIFIGNTFSFSIVICLLSFFSFIVSYFTNQNYNLLFKLNPVSNIILNWHSSSVLKNQSIISITNFDFNFTIIYFVLLSIIFTITGAAIINNCNVTLDNK